ncbi:hypothetical protein LP421_28330 [Rhizobium sp. RCAM05350]|nr:hypothetical protein LP421_28330 [Rhizobium sp. RCAM05350]
MSNPTDDIIDGTEADETLDGGDGNDIIHGGGGTNTLLGGNGNDQLFADYGSTNTIDGGDGDDIIELAENTVNTIDGDADTDIVRILSGDFRASTVTNVEVLRNLFDDRLGRFLQRFRYHSRRSGLCQRDSRPDAFIRRQRRLQDRGRHQRHDHRQHRQ